MPSRGSKFFPRGEFTRWIEGSFQGVFFFYLFRNDYYYDLLRPKVNFTIRGNNLRTLVLPNLLPHLSGWEKKYTRSFRLPFFLCNNTGNSRRKENHLQILCMKGSSDKYRTEIYDSVRNDIPYMEGGETNGLRFLISPGLAKGKFC